VLLNSPADSAPPNPAPQLGIDPGRRFGIAKPPIEPGRDPAKALHHLRREFVFFSHLGILPFAVVSVRTMRHCRTFP
jgi:hypothetical protein